MLTHELNTTTATLGSTRARESVGDFGSVLTGCNPQGQVTPSPGQNVPLGRVWPANVPIVSITNTTQTNIDRLIKSISYAGSLDLAARGLISAAERGYASRKLDVVEEAGKLLYRLPAPFSAVGSYFLGLAAQRLGKGDLNAALLHAERASREASPVYRTRALLSVASIAYYKGDAQSETEILQRLIRSDDLYTKLEAARALSIHLSKNQRGGDARRLLSLNAPLALRSPVLLPHWANSLAVEYLGSGNVEAAKYYTLMALSSPLAGFYGEVQETAKEVAKASQKATKPYVVQPCHAFWKVIHHDFTVKAVAKERAERICQINDMLLGFNIDQVKEVQGVCTRIRDDRVGERENRR